MLFFAEASPSPVALKEWLEVFLYLGGVILCGAGVWKLLLGKPSPTELTNQPVSVRQEHDLVTQDELEKLEKKLEADSAKQASSRKGIYANLEEHGKEIASLKAQFTAVNGQLSNLDNKMDQVLLRLPTRR